MTGPNPTDRGKLGSKIHLVTDRNGLPLSLGISGANIHDSQGLDPLVRGIPPIRSRRGPRRRRPAKLHADKGYDHDHLRRWLRSRGIAHRIARKGTSSPLSDWDVTVGCREVRVLADRMPAIAPPLRAQGGTLPRLRRHSRGPYRLPPTDQVRRGSVRHGDPPGGAVHAHHTAIRNHQLWVGVSEVDVEDGHGVRGIRRQRAQY